MRASLTRIAALLLTSVVILTGCVRPTNDGSSGGKPDAAKTLVVGATAQPPTMDPTAHTAAAVAQVMLYNVYETLVKIDSEGKLRPLLASSWEVSTDRKTYTFKLQPDAKFASGRPVNAADVQWSLERVKNGKGIANLAKQMSVIESIQAPDEHTLKVQLTRPSNAWLYDVAGPAGVVFDRGVGEDFSHQSAGSGPYQLKEWKQGQSVELSRNTQYWGTPTRFDSVIFRYFADANAMNASMLAGDLDIISNVQAPQSINQFNDASRFTVIEGTTNGEVVLGLNNNTPALKNVKVRQAIRYAIDRKALMQSVWNGKGTLIGSMVPPTDPWYEDLANAYPYDPAKAKQLLAESGVGPVKLRLRVPTLAYATASAQFVQSQLKDVGIEVVIDELEFPGRWVELVMTKSDYDMTIVGHVEPRDIVQFGNKDYYWHYDSQTVRDELAKADAGTDQEYVDGMKKVAKQISDDAACDWLFLLPNLVVTKKEISGVSKNLTSTSFDLTMVAARR